MKGWFDAFRTNGGPTLYSYSNRTPVTGDPITITLYVVFFTIFAAFLVIFPGVRKERFTTFVSVTLSLFVGTVILVCNFGCGWHVGKATILSSYKAFSPMKLESELGVNIGLNSANVTLTAMPKYNESDQIDFNERFHWTKADDIKRDYRRALQKGLPYPILTVAEYFTLDSEGFCWGRRYREAGYYGCILLWASFATWLLMNILLCVVPRYGAYAMIWTGSLMLLTNFVYFKLLPPRPLIIPFEGALLTLHLGWCFWLVLIAGSICAGVGATIAIIDWIIPHKFSTILEVDYGTPYDRHTIIEDQKDTRQKFKFNIPKLEEPLQEVGSRILRRLSTRLSRRGTGNAELEAELSRRADLQRYSSRLGVDNAAFYPTPPPLPLEATLSNTGKSSKAVSFRSESRERPPIEVRTSSTFQPDDSDHSESDVKERVEVVRVPSIHLRVPDHLEMMPSISLPKPALKNTTSTASRVSHSQVAMGGDDLSRPSSRKDSEHSNSSSSSSTLGLAAILTDEDSYRIHPMPDDASNNVLREWFATARDMVRGYQWTLPGYYIESYGGTDATNCSSPAALVEDAVETCSAACFLHDNWMALADD
ncbi:unnamed protein product [Darwinula stevensoni]|uniref:Dual oxidase maturation factor 1 n=1 Tax=Darwinula stevensoni TaxID=69355 RepID=A0A7R9FR99_9CRUS|nr:unnamed protein product [Darwinula stevensoni]CAG0900599.1 unnamed protein product [Darwinula stevensoni]